MRDATRAVVIGCVTLVAMGCVSLAPRSQPASASATLIPGVPARRWAENSCAAGALSEVLNSFGNPVTERQLSRELTKARSGGVITVDLLIAARRYGFDAQLMRGTDEILRAELVRGHPLILMLRVLDARGERNDLFHYVVLSGIDERRDLVALQYGDGKKRWVSLAAIRDAWAAAGYATFLIGPRRRPAAVEDDLRRAVMLEEAGHIEQAIGLYRLYLGVHPQSALAWTNLGNAQASLHQKDLAEVAYRNALFVEKDSRDALNNLAFLLLEQGRLDEAETLARRAAAQETADRHFALDTLGRILSARGDCRAAEATFEQALQLMDERDHTGRTGLEKALAMARSECGERR